MFAFSIRKPINFSVSMFANSGGGIAFILTTIRERLHPPPCNCLPVPLRLGSQIGALCQQIHHHRRETGIRSIQGVLALVKRFGAAATEDACSAALELRVYEYHFVRRYLERRPQPALKHIDPLIRELTEYRDFINSKTEEQQL